MLAMADGEGTVTLEEYARTRGVARRAIQFQVEKGVIEVVDGRIDPAQADASWGAIRRASRLGQHQRNEAGERSAKAKVAVTLAKLRLSKQRFETVRDRYVDRAEAIAVGESEARFVVEALRASPAGYADTLAAELDVTPEVAAYVLDRFIGLILGEIGDLPRQAVRAAERA
jgi:hypothetical protein